MKTYLSILTGLTLLATLSKAQDFRKEARLQPVEQNGFYNILLTPEITGSLKEDLSDIRLYDADGHEVPYLLRSEQPKAPQQLFRGYTLLQNKTIPGCCTELILQNADKNKINNISLIIRNSDVRKTARLSGSDDNQNWYNIKDNYYLESIYNNNETSEVKILNFPLSNYEYYRLTIDDSLNAPLKIVKAGYYDVHYEDGKYLSLPTAAVQQKDSSDKNSYIRLAFPSSQVIDKIKFDLAGPQYYLRNVRVGQMQEDKGKKYFSSLQSTYFKSNQDNVIFFDRLKAEELYLVIENKDNPPLRVNDAKGFQLTHYLTAGLEKGKKYYLRFDAPEAGMPQYDLEYFRDSIESTMKMLEPTGLRIIGQKASVARDDFFKSTLWIWGALALIVVLLGYMSVKMLKEMKKSQ